MNPSKEKNMNLPTQKTPPKTSMSDIAMLVYGRPKIGKSTFASQSPNAIFLATEAGLNALDVYQMPISNWEEFLEACSLIAKGNHEFKTVVIDTLDNLYRYCADYVCKKLGVGHESEAAHGKAYGVIKNELIRVLSKLALLPYGLILISHSQDKEMQTRTGSVVRTVPTIPESFRQVVIGLVDLILYCDVEAVEDEEGKRHQVRVAKTKPNAAYDAGDRFNRLPEVMRLSYSDFEKAFASIPNETEETES